MKTKATLGICVKNCEHTIKETINSIINQDFPHEYMEIIFVDDGSQDRTSFLILDSLSSMDMHVKIFQQDWKGLGPTRNLIVENAVGDYIIWVDGDTILRKDYVRKLVNYMEQNPTVGIAKGKFMTRFEENLIATLESMGALASDFRHQGKESQKLPGTSGSVYRAKAVREIGGFDDRIKGAGEDVDAAFRIREAGWGIHFTRESEYFAKCKETWKALWDRYLWHGYGLHYVLHKDSAAEKLYEMVPPAAFLSGLLHSSVAYKLTRRKLAFFLPFHFIFKSIAWCLGFIRAHVDDYGHALENSGIREGDS